CRHAGVATGDDRRPGARVHDDGAGDVDAPVPGQGESAAVRSTQDIDGGEGRRGHTAGADQEVAVAAVGDGDRLTARRQGGRGQAGATGGQVDGAEVGVRGGIEEIDAAGRRAAAGSVGGDRGGECHALPRDGG